MLANGFTPKAEQERRQFNYPVMLRAPSLASFGHGPKVGNGPGDAASTQNPGGRGERRVDFDHPGRGHRRRAVGVALLTTRVVV